MTWTLDEFATVFASGDSDGVNATIDALDDMEIHRRRVGYGSGGIERDTEELIRETTAFLDAMRQLVDSDTNE